MKKKNEYYTPKEYIDKVSTVLGGIDLDPFSCQHANDNHIHSKHFFTKERSAFTSSWMHAFRGSVYMNAPYSNGEYKPSVEHFLKQLKFWGFKAITLTNNNTGTITTQKLMKEASAYCLPEKRINYFTESGSTKGNRYAQLFCYFGNEIHLFNKTFEDIGQVSYNPDYLIKNIL